MISAQEEWINAEEAAKILSSNSGHSISKKYPKRLAALGKVEVWRINTKMLLYKRVSVEGYRVKQQPQRA